MGQQAVDHHGTHLTYIDYMGSLRACLLRGLEWDFHGFSKSRKLTKNTHPQKEESWMVESLGLGQILGPFPKSIPVAIHLGSQIDPVVATVIGIGFFFMTNHDNSQPHELHMLEVDQGESIVHKLFFFVIFHFFDDTPVNRLSKIQKLRPPKNAS